MNQVANIENQGDVIQAPFGVDVSRGTLNSTVSSEWFSRPDDQKFLNLSDLHDFTKSHADNSQADVVDVKTIEVRADRADPDHLGLILPNQEIEVKPTNWSFGQLCSLSKAPAGYLRKLPGQIAAINLQYSVQNLRSELVKTYVTDQGELRAATGPDYGRIHDYEVVEAVRKIAGNGTGDARWKVPGQIDWATSQYNPNVDITKDTTTLYASDRDVFLFLVDDRNPIEIGKLANGDPDYVFRGFYIWNSEVGSKSFGVACFYLRGVCQNRCLWGVEGFQELSFRHSKNAPDRFLREIAPALRSFSDGSSNKLLEGVTAAKAAVVAKDDDDRSKFLKDRGFSAKAAQNVLTRVLQEEHKPAESVWDFVQGITAVARDEKHQDTRIALERQAGKLLDKVA